MKVHNTTIFMGDMTRDERHGNIRNEKRENSTNIFAGNLNKNFDPIAQKKKEARKQAMKIVTDTWDGDRKIDRDMEERENKIAQLRHDLKQARKDSNDIKEIRAGLRENYGVLEDSQEEKDLKLLEKEIDAKTPGKDVSISKEEAERINQLKENGLTEYQKHSLELKKDEAYYDKQAYDIEKQIETENAIIRGTKLERLKKDPMVAASKQAQEVLDAASKEIVGMLMDEAKDHIDEEMEEKKEAAKKKAEEEKEEKEKLEAIKEKKEQQEELTEEILESTEQMTEISSAQSDVLQEVKDLVNKMKLLEEDIKGAAVDEVL